MPRSLKLSVILLLFAILSQTIPASQADILHLKNGRKIRGEIDEKQSDDKKVVITLPTGKATFPRKLIKRIEREDKTQYLIKQGLNLSRIGSHEEGIACLREAVVVTKNSAKARRALAYALARRGNSLLSTGQAGSALEDYAEALKLDPSSNFAKEGMDAAKKATNTTDGQLSDASKAAKNDMDKAIAKYEAVLKKDPGYINRVKIPLSELYVKKANGILRSKFKSSKSLDTGVCLKAGLLYDKALRLNGELMDQIASRWALTRIILAYSDPSIVNAGDLATAANLSLQSPVGQCAQALRFEKLGKPAEAMKLWTAVGGTGAPDKVKAKAMSRALSSVDLINPKTSKGWVNSTSHWQKFDSPHFIVHHRNGTLGRKVLKQAEHHYSTMFAGFRKSYGRIMGRKIELWIYENYAEYVKNGGPPGSAGVTKTLRVGPGLFRVRILVFQSSSQLLTATLPHELVHAFMPMLIGHNKTPHWLHEGLATNHEPSLKQNYYQRLVFNAKQRRRLIPAKTIVGLKSYPSENQVDVFYGQAFLLVKYLIRQKGLRAVVSMLRDLDKMSVTDSIYKHFRIRDLDKLDVAFKNVKKQ